MGSITIRITADDGNLATATDEFILTVQNTNDAPTVENAIADQNAIEDSPYSFLVPTNTFGDVDAGDSLTLTATLADGSALPAWLMIDSAGQFTGTPTNDDVGLISIVVTATDQSGSTVSAMFDLTVENTNDAPVLNTPTADVTVNEDSPYLFSLPDGAFTDVDDGDTLTYTATLDDGSALPSWLTFDGSTQTFSGTPLNDDVGTITIRLTADDGNLGTATDEFVLTVQNTNDAPTVENAIADQNAIEDLPYSFLVPADTFGDVDAGDSLTLTATLADGSPLPAWLTFDANGQFTGKPTNDDVGGISIVVTATDQSGSQISTNFDLVVENVNDAPVVAAPIADVTIDEEVPYSFVIPAGTFVDVDNETLTFTVTQADGTALPDWLTFDNETLEFTGTPDDPNVGTIDIVVTASDLTESVSDEFSLTVNNINDAPTVQGLTADVGFNDPFTLSASEVSGLTEDPDSVALQPIVTPINGGAVSINPDGSITFTPTTGFFGVAQFALQASDGSLVSEAGIVSIQVAGPGVIAGANIPDTPVSEEEQEALEEIVNDALQPPTPTDDDDEDDTPTNVSSPNNPVSVLLDETDDDEVAVFERPENEFRERRRTAFQYTAAVQNSPQKTVSERASSLERRVVNEAINQIDFALLTSPGQLWSQLDATREELNLEIQSDLLVVGSIGAATSGFTVGVVAYLLRGGFLLSGFLAQMPVWRSIDPLLIMQGIGGDGESLEDLFDKESDALEDD